MSVALILAFLGAWLLAGVVCVALCVSAASGDRGQAPASVPRARRTRRFARGLQSLS